MLRKNRQRRNKRKQSKPQEKIQAKPQWDQSLPYDMYKKNQKENEEYFERLWGNKIDMEKQNQLDYHKHISRKYKHG